MSPRARVLAALIGLALVGVRARPSRVDAAPPEAARFRFVDVAAKAGITRVLLAGRPDKDHLLDSSGGGAAFLDYDRDGRLDVYLVNGWRLEGSRVVERGKNALYHGRADGTFEDVTDAAGVGGEGQWGQGVAVADYDNDGWPDILVTNFGRNVLYRNLGNGRFRGRGEGGRHRVAGLEHRRRVLRRRRRRLPRPLRRVLHRRARSSRCWPRGPRSPGAAWRRWPSDRSA